MAAALDPDSFSSAVSTHLSVPNGMDGAEHTRYRAVVDKYMTRERTAAIEPICRAVAEDLVADIPSGVPVDVVGGLGGATPFGRKANGSAGRLSWRTRCCSGWKTTMRQQGGANWPKPRRSHAVLTRLSLA